MRPAHESTAEEETKGLNSLTVMGVGGEEPEETHVAKKELLARLPETHRPIPIALGLVANPIYSSTVVVVAAAAVR